jgi:hypothetical protein
VDVVRTCVANGRLKEFITLSPIEGVCVMPFSGIVEPEQLTILALAVDQHCRQAGIDPESPEGQAVAQMVLTLFQGGAATTEELKAALLVHSERVTRYRVEHSSA